MYQNAHLSLYSGDCCILQADNRRNQCVVILSEFFRKIHFFHKLSYRARNRSSGNLGNLVAIVIIAEPDFAGDVTGDRVAIESGEFNNLYIWSGSDFFGCLASAVDLIVKYH